MKRKSILMTIVAVLFASIAWGQAPSSSSPKIPLPSVTEYNNALNASSGALKDADTIYFCANTDSIYPIEFGYDVSGRRLHPSYGDWRLVAKTDSAMAILEYNFVDTIKNGGAGNAFNAVGSGIGGALFEYTAKDALCGLAVGDKYWVYVFILPEEKKPITKADSFICFDEDTHGWQDIKFSDVFAKYSLANAGLYAQAGLVTQWQSDKMSRNKSGQIKLDSVATYILRDTLLITLPLDPALYTCGDSIVFSLKVRVDSVARDTIPKAYSICVTDTIGEFGKRDVRSIFDRNLGGKYDKTTIAAPWRSMKEDPAITSAPYNQNDTVALFRYEYNDCDGNPHTIVDTLKLIKTILHDGRDVGIDTLIHCRRETSTLPIVNFYSKGEVWYTNKPIFSASNTDSYWEDWGIVNENLSSVTTPDDKYGTISGYSSLVDGGYYLNLPDMASNVGYYYRWNVDASVHECFVDKDGDPGFGKLVIILQDPFIAQDFTVQVCKDSYAASEPFNFGNYTNLAVKWYRFGTGYDEIVPNSMDKSTYKYTYEAVGDCAEGKGVFYVKITSNVKVPKSKKVKYCKEKLPAFINLNDVLGVAVSSLKWTGKAPNDDDLVTAGVLNETTGNLDVGKYVKLYGKKSPKVFTIQDLTSNSCGIPVGTNGVKLEIEFVSTL